MTAEHFDAVVVGSGFGGSVMAYRLAEAGKRVCVLERGKRYPPGSFARSPHEMRTNFWDPSAGNHGLFHIWRFSGIDGVVSAGLGGGSLIYANVLIRKDPGWFYRRRPDGGRDVWPLTRDDLEAHYDAVEKILAPQYFPFDIEPYASTPKTVGFQHAAQAAGLDWHLPLLAVTFGDPVNSPVLGEPITGSKDNLHGRTRETCRLCGECDIGCNYGSKNTLDYNYLSLAQKHGAELRDRCEVRSFVPDGPGYSLRYVEHRPENEGRPTDTSRLVPVELITDRLIISAGTFGTNYLMLKNRTNLPSLSPRLGHFFSGNGDLLGLIHEASELRNGARAPRLLAPSKGTVITSTVRVDDSVDGGTGPGYYIQDGGYPSLVDWLLEATDVGGELHRGLRLVGERIIARLRGTEQPNAGIDVEALLGDTHRSGSALPLLGMGLDMPNGTFSLGAGERLGLDWTEARSADYFGRVIQAMQRIASGLEAEFLVNPLWHLHHKLITVHPVGGCAMGTSPEDGVVDTYGQVFGQPNLLIADGSVMPGPVGPNPSFTIAALSDRFADHLLETP